MQLLWIAGIYKQNQYVRIICYLKLFTLVTLPFGQMEKADTVEVERISEHLSLIYYLNFLKTY